jgi:hypothetical protein
MRRLTASCAGIFAVVWFTLGSDAWADEMGFYDFWLAGETFDAIQANNRKLKKILGDSEFSEFLTVTEDEDV